MTVQRYHFHCVGGGGDAVFDLPGRWVARLRELGLQADRVAQAVMAGAPGTDWSDWLVDVHDARGRRVLVRAFTDAFIEQKDTAPLAKRGSQADRVRRPIG